MIWDLVTEICAAREDGLENPSPHEVVDLLDFAGVKDPEQRCAVLALAFPGCCPPDLVPDGMEELKEAAELAAVTMSQALEE